MRKLARVHSTAELATLQPRKIRNLDKKWVTNDKFEDIGISFSAMLIEVPSRKFFNERLVEIVLRLLIDKNCIIVLRVVAPEPMHQLRLAQLGEISSFDFVWIENSKLMMRHETKIPVFCLYLDIASRDGFSCIFTTSKSSEPSEFKKGLVDGRFVGMITRNFLSLDGKDFSIEKTYLDPEFEKIAQNKEKHEILYSKEVIKDLFEETTLQEFISQARLFMNICNKFCGLPIGDNSKTDKIFQNRITIESSDGQPEIVVLSEDEILQNQMARCKLKYHVEDFNSDDMEESAEDLNKTVANGFVFGESEESEEEENVEDLLDDDSDVALDDPADLYTSEIKRQSTTEAIRDEEECLTNQLQNLAANINSTDSSSEEDAFMPARPSTPEQFSIRNPMTINPSTPRKKNPFLYRQRVENKPVWRRFLFRQNSEEPAKKRAKTDVIYISSDSDE